MKGWEGVGITKQTGPSGPGARGGGDQLRPRRVWVLRKEGREAIDLQPVPGWRRDCAHGGRALGGDAEPTGPLTRAQFVRE
jgi:hypothetical protein